MAQLDLFQSEQAESAPSPVLLPPGIRVGASGWSYRDWVGPFYSRGLAQSDWLEAYSRCFLTVEIDSTFYGPPDPSVVRRWRDRVPPDFRFAAKFPRAVTHDRMLVGAEADIASFLGAIEGLGEKLGPLLVQLPAQFRLSDPNRRALEQFLGKLPNGFRYALELRDRRWLGHPLHALLREHRVALALCDFPGMPANDVATAPFAYLRLIGDRSAVSTFERAVIDRRADLISWTGVMNGLRKRGSEVFAYVNNHYAGHAPATIQEWAKLIRGIDPAPGTASDSGRRSATTPSDSP